MTFDQFYIALFVIGIPVFFVIALRKEDWIVILILFCVGIGILLLGALWAWVIDELGYFQRWLLFQDSDRFGFRIIPASYGFIVASIVLALRRLMNR
jgi:hypothetical protein